MPDYLPLVIPVLGTGGDDVNNNTAALVMTVTTRLSHPKLLPPTSAMGQNYFITIDNRKQLEHVSTNKIVMYRISGCEYKVITITIIIYMEILILWVNILKVYSTEIPECSRMTKMFI